MGFCEELFHEIQPVGAELLDTEVLPLFLGRFKLDVFFAALRIPKDPMEGFEAV